jgi:hypothetical protein
MVAQCALLRGPGAIIAPPRGGGGAGRGRTGSAALLDPQRAI